MILHLTNRMEEVRPDLGGVWRVLPGIPEPRELAALLRETGAAEWRWHGAEMTPRAELVAPVRGRDRAWEGHRPWQRHPCEVWIPVIDPMETLPTVIELLRGQTVRPYIVLVDTGSTPEQLARVEALRAEDVEVHRLHSGGQRHSSAIVATALDLAVSLCRTERLLLTHQDCFLRRREAVEILTTWLSPEAPAVGYQITPRVRADDWSRMMGHVWGGLYLPVIRGTRARWGHTEPWGQADWDTEYSFNRLLAADGIRPVLLGGERNWARNVTPDFDHVRSWPLSGLYKPEHRERARQWMADALREAKERIDLWTEW